MKSAFIMALYTVVLPTSEYSNCSLQRVKSSFLIIVPAKYYALALKKGAKASMIYPSTEMVTRFSRHDRRIRGFLDLSYKTAHYLLCRGHFQTQRSCHCFVRIGKHLSSTHPDSSDRLRRLFLITKCSIAVATASWEYLWGYSAGHVTGATMHAAAAEYPQGQVLQLAVPTAQYCIMRPT